MASLRKALETDALKTEHGESLHPPLEILSGIMGRLELKGKPFKVFQPATDTDIQNFWGILKDVEEALKVKHFKF